MRATNPSEALGLALVDELGRAGVRHACVSPGSRSAPVALALAQDERIEVYVQIDERSCSFLGLGIAKTTGRPVVLLCTSGTAAAELHPAVQEAHQSGVPLLVLTADRPPELRDTGAAQTIDQLKLYGDAVRWFFDLGPPEDGSAVSFWRSVGSRAYAEALGFGGGGPGPVHLNLAFREPLVPTAGTGAGIDVRGRGGGRPWTSVEVAGQQASQRDVEHLVEAMLGAERGLVVAGEGAEGAASLVQVAEAAAWPVLADPLSGVRYGRNAIASYDALLRSPAWAGRHRPDIAVRVGRPPLSKPLQALLGADVPQLVIQPHRAWQDPARSAGRIIAADPGALFEGAAACLTSRPDTAWLAEWLDAESIARGAIDGILDSIPTVTEPRTARDLARALPEDSVLVVAASMPVRDLELFMAPRGGLRVIANRGANGIDGFVSTALGVAVATEAPVAALCGDLALLHDQNGLMLAGRADIDAVFVVVNNDGGGIFSFLPQAELPRHFELLFGTPHGLDLGRVAALYGCGHTRVTAAEGLPAAVGAAARDGGVHIVEVRTNRADNVALHLRLASAVTSRLEG